MGRIAFKQAGHTGSREIFSREAPQRRQSEGNSAANKLWATRAAPETAKWNRSCPAETGRRFVSPVLLKTDLPRPAPGQAPAGRLASSIARGGGASNCSRGHARPGFRALLALAGGNEDANRSPPEAIDAAHGLEEQKGLQIFLQEVSAARAISVRTATIRTLIVNEHDLISQSCWKGFWKWL